jgi:hypothetical protein
MTTERRPQGRVERGVRADLRRLGVTPSGSALAALAVELAMQLDQAAGDPDVGASGSAALARELRQLLAALSAKTGARGPTERDSVDELQQRRAARRQQA